MGKEKRNPSKGPAPLVQSLDLDEVKKTVRLTDSKAYRAICALEDLLKHQQALSQKAVQKIKDLCGGAPVFTLSEMLRFLSFYNEEKEAGTDYTDRQAIEAFLEKDGLTLKEDEFGHWLDALQGLRHYHADSIVKISEDIHRVKDQFVIFKKN